MFQLVYVLLAMNPSNFGFGNPCFNIVSLSFVHIICWVLVSSNCIWQTTMVVTLQIGRIVHMTNHSCLANNTFHVIKHDPIVLQIPYRSSIHVTRLAPPPTPFIDILKMNTFAPKLFLGTNTLGCSHNDS